MADMFVVSHRFLSRKRGSFGRFKKVVNNKMKRAKEILRIDKYVLPRGLNTRQTNSRILLTVTVK